MTDRRLWRWLDLRVALIVLLVLTSTAHVGRLFAAREYAQQAFIGYVLAVGIDGVLALSLYEATRASKRQHRAFALGLFVITCTVSAGFNVAYYRAYYPSDVWWVSGLLGSTAPVLAALVAVLRAFGDVERVQDAHSLEIELAQIAQEAETERVRISTVGVAKERTKQERLKFKQAQLAGDVDAPTNGHKRQYDDFVRAIVSGDLSLEMSGAEIGQWAGRSASTGRRWKMEYQEVAK